jgi:hypothetical protein
MLFENTFYENGSQIASRIMDLCKQVEPQAIASLAIKARNEMKLRHAPLMLATQLSIYPGIGDLVAMVIEEVVQRPDELAEFLSLYWKHGARDGKPGKHPLSAGVKRGLARAFKKFSDYQLAKWNKDGEVKLRDVLFLCHAKPIRLAGEYRELVPAAPITKGKYKRGLTFRDSLGQGESWAKLVNGTLEPPDTWEVSLSAGKEKCATFEALLREDTLGDIALLMNLRNMIASGVDEGLIRARLSKGCPKALPFRFVTAARHAPRLEDALEEAMLKSMEGVPQLPGVTGLLVDVSASMSDALHPKTEVTRVDVAAALAIILREKAERVRIATFSNYTVEIPPRRGFAVRDAIHTSQEHSWTRLKASIKTLRPNWQDLDRLIVITDEQSQDGNGMAFAPKSYLINVAPYQNGVEFPKGERDWTRINGWSEAVLDFIMAIEQEG